METKVCSKCKTEKPILGFRVVRKKDNDDLKYRADCRVCERNRASKYRENPDYREKQSKNNKEWRKNNKAHRDNYIDKYRNENSDKISEQTKLYKKINAENIKKKNAEYYDDPINRQRKNELTEKWQKENIDLVRKWNRERKQERYKNDDVYRFKVDIRSFIQHSFRRNKFVKNEKSIDILGCDFGQLKKHLESKFTNGMSWENKGKWHIDHIIPLAAAENKEELTALCHHKNLQPLWALENLTKHDDFDPKDKEKYLEWYSKNVIKK